MLQDAQAGKQLEVEILAAVVEVADLIAVVPMPCVRALYAMTVLLNSIITTRTAAHASL